MANPTSRSSAFRRTVRCASARALVLLAAGAMSSAWGTMPPIDPPRRHVLPNGLTVLLAEDHARPLVSVLVWYRAGARHERPGITGMAHYLEHVAFRATENLPAQDVTGVIERLGGHWHGYTRLDNTAYYETTRREALDWLLFLEAERMQRLRITPDDVEVERGTILSELKGYENDPWSLLFDDVAAVAFREHPYGYNISGWVSDIEGIAHADVIDFYRRHYAPAGAILVLVGDFDAGQALRLVERRFGPLPKKPALEPLRTLEPLQRGERRLVLGMPGAAAHVMVAYHAPAFGDPDFETFRALDAVLGGGRGFHTLEDGFEITPLSPERRTSRLGRELVASGAATRVTTGLLPSLHPYLYWITAEAAPGVGLDALEGRLIDTIEGMATRPPSAAESERARGRLLALAAMQTDTLQERAHALATIEALGGEAAWKRARAPRPFPTPEEIQAVARRYLRADNRTVGRFEPRQESGATEAAAAGGGAAADAARSTGAGAPADGDDHEDAEALPAGRAAKGESRRGSSAAPARRPRLTPPAIDARHIPPDPAPERRRLPSGLELAAISLPASPTAALAVDIEAGPLHDPPGREGAAALTSRLVLAGDATRGHEEIAAAVDALALSWSVRVGGASLQFPDPARVRLESEFAAGDARQALTLVADALRAPLFPAAELRAARQAQQSEVAGAQDDTTALAWSRLLAALYPGSGYGRPALGSPHSLTALRRADLERFHYQRYRPERMRISFAGGGLQAREALDLLERHFSAWPPAPEPAAQEGAGASPSRAATGEPLPPEPVVLAHKTQTDLAYGLLTGVEAHAAGRQALDALAYILHHNYGGRLGQHIIMERGLAYEIDSVLAVDLPGSPWLFATGAPPQKIEPLRCAWEEILDETAARGVSADELAAARTYLQGRRLHERESSLGAARAALEWMRRPDGAAEPDPARLRLEDVNRLARALLAGRRGVWSQAGPLP